MEDQRGIVKGVEKRQSGVIIKLQAFVLQNNMTRPYGQAGTNRYPFITNLLWQKGLLLTRKEEQIETE
jgi:hypothetical protein